MAYQWVRARERTGRLVWGPGRGPGWGVEGARRVHGTARPMWVARKEVGPTSIIPADASLASLTHLRRNIVIAFKLPSPSPTFEKNYLRPPGPRDSLAFESHTDTSDSRLGSTEGWEPFVAHFGGMWWVVVLRSIFDFFFFFQFSPSLPSVSFHRDVDRGFSFLVRSDPGEVKVWLVMS